MFQKYKPSGKFSPSFLLWLVLASLVMLAIAYVYQIALHWIPMIYINVLLTVGVGFAVAFASGFVIKYGKVRSVPIAVLCAAALGALLLGGKFAFQYLNARAEMATVLNAMNADELKEQFGAQVDAVDLESLKPAMIESYTFGEHLQQRVESGWRIGKFGRGQNPVTGIVVYLVWLIEAGIVFFIGMTSAISSANEPFSEKLGLWADENEVVMELPVPDAETIATIQTADSVQSLIDIPLPKSLDSNRFAVYTVHSVPGVEMEDAYLTVELQDHVLNSKGEPEIKKTPLVANAILSSAQRYQIKENAETMKEAFEDYRASKASETAPSQQA